jgi:hypothetical protein
MPRIGWTVLLGVTLVWARFATAGEPLPPAGDCRCGVKCHAEPAYCLSPGCGESRRHCFDNAWDGYCGQRACWDTFWCKVGTGALYPCTPCPTHDGRGVALEVRLRPSAAACGQQGCGATIPAAQR